ncbi:MAG: hypothetical protein ACLR2G_01320 [Phascolarctobacterium faecium]
MDDYGSFLYECCGKIESFDFGEITSAAAELVKEGLRDEAFYWAKVLKCRRSGNAAGAHRTLKDEETKEH